MPRYAALASADWQALQRQATDCRLSEEKDRAELHSAYPSNKIDSLALLPPQGAFHNAQMQQAGVELLSAPSPGSATGTVVVLTTPDADRTFMSYLGSSQPLELTPETEEAISSTRLLIIEGYLWEMKVCTAACLPCMLHSSCGMLV